MADGGDRRVAALLQRYGLPAALQPRYERLLDALVDEPLAPTGVCSRAGAIDDHLADSLVALELPQVRDADTIADLGSGAGLPALPLALARPTTRFALIESSGRKCDYLRRVAAECGTTNVSVVHARAEDVARGNERFDVVTARALASLAVVAEYAAPLLGLGGTLVVWRGRRDDEAEHKAESAAETLGLAAREIRRVLPYPQAHDRHLYVMSKVGPTPDRFPRRAGMAVKRPLGG